MGRGKMPGSARIFVGAAWLLYVESMIVMLLDIEMFEMLGATLPLSE